MKVIIIFLNRIVLHKNYYIYNVHLHIFSEKLDDYVFIFYQFILCIKVLRYNYQKNK